MKYNLKWLFAVKLMLLTFIFVFVLPWEKNIIFSQTNKYKDLLGRNIGIEAKIGGEPIYGDHAKKNNKNCIVTCDKREIILEDDFGITDYNCNEEPCFPSPEYEKEFLKKNQKYISDNPEFVKVLTISKGGGPTLSSVRAKGFIQVGVNDSFSGFGKTDDNGVWKGFDVDCARAVSVAVFGSPDKLKFTPLTSKTRFTALQSREIDMLFRNLTQTLSKDTALGLDFATVTYYDGQGFLIPKDLGIKSAKELDGATVCVLPGTSTEFNVTEYFRANGMKMNPIVIENTAELNKAFFAGRCDCLTADTSHLAGQRAVAPNPDDYMILPEIISKKPLAPAVRHGDNQWKDIINYSLLAMINAEELGINSKNITEMVKSQNPKIKRFFGISAGNGKALGLSEKFTYNIIKQVGNYQEVFERNLGIDSPLKIERGLNSLWTSGGLLYSPPFR